MMNQNKWDQLHEKRARIYRKMDELAALIRRLEAFKEEADSLNSKSILFMEETADALSQHRKRQLLAEQRDAVREEGNKQKEYLASWMKEQKKEHSQLEEQANALTRQMRDLFY